MNPTPRPVKLACRNVWKVFGPRPSFYFDSRGYTIEPNELAERMRAERHIPAVVDANFEVATGEIFVIMGLSGSGKSTLVRCLSRLVEPSAGEILLDGQDLLKASHKELTDLRRHAMGMVFQSFGLLPHLTVLENVAFPLRVQGKSQRDREARAHEVVELVGLKGRENAYPAELSGGQQQRVGIARSLAVGPDLWFLDEPFSALDPLIRRQMQEEFLRLQKQLKKTIVFITHDIVEAFRLADRLALMRDGKIVQIGRPVDIALNPVDEYVARFTQEIPLLQIVTARDLASAVADQVGDVISADTLLVDLVPRLAAGAPGFRVMDGTEVIGGLTAAMALAALDRSTPGRAS